MFTKLKDKLFNDDCPKYEAYVSGGTVRGDPAGGEKNGILTAAKEYAELKLVLDNNTADDTTDSWNWICGKIAYFKVRGLDQRHFRELSIYAIRNFPRQYAGNFASFLKIIGSVTYITAACEHLLREHRMEEALAVAKPCMAYLKDRTDLYPDGQLCASRLWKKQFYTRLREATAEKIEPMTIMQDSFYVMPIFC